MGRPSKFPEEFREQAVEMVRATGKTIARSLVTLADQRHHVGQLGQGGPPTGRGAALLPGEQTERAELARLRRENAKLKDGAGDPEKSGGLLRDGVDEVTRFAFVDREKAHHPLNRAVPAAEGQPVGLLRLGRPGRHRRGGSPTRC